jgi:hypothetical protein
MGARELYAQIEAAERQANRLYAGLSQVVAERRARLRREQAGTPTAQERAVADAFEVVERLRAEYARLPAPERAAFARVERRRVWSEMSAEDRAIYAALNRAFAEGGA